MGLHILDTYAGKSFKVFLSFIHSFFLILVWQEPNS